MSKAAAIQVENLDVYYGDSIVLHNVSCRIPAGKVFAILGRNGVGKTTFLKTLIGLLRPKRGDILFEDRKINKLSPGQRSRLGLGYVPQNREIFPKLTVYENLQMGLESLAKEDRKNDEERYAKVHNLFPVLAQMYKRLGGNLSGGQQQQLAIARALVGNPRILLLDEPTEGIQPSIIQDIEQALRTIMKAGNMTIILVEQNLNFAQRLADEYCIFNRGSIVYQGSKSDLTDDYIKKHLTV